VAVLRENIHYGFRRNVWGVKRAGIIVAAASSFVLGAQIAGFLMAHQTVPLTVPIILAANVALLAWWSFVVSEPWVIRAGNLYADRLLEALDTL
jgi:hypothetical protein